MDCDGADGLLGRETYEGVGRLQTRGEMRGRRALEGEGGGSWLWLGGREGSHPH